ncbi:UNVERIFIED_CONTAM: hypothetical protein Sradi_1914600 [Sesamum radiatum]|uniref:Uncharacterized protein n=1 Tax=Sesamum radiatum TaxID=300843 RepID=A0AAW2TZ41_SESRA
MEELARISRIITIMLAIISSRRPIRSFIAEFGGGDSGGGVGGGGGDVYVRLEKWPQNQGRIIGPCSCPNCSQPHLLLDHRY